MMQNTYRCRACSAFLCFGPVTSTDLRMKKYRHDRSDCPDGPQTPLRTHGAGNPVLFFDDDAAWRTEQVAPLDGVNPEKTMLVGPAVPK